MKTSQMRILADENIPCVHSAFGTLGTVRTMAGRAMQPPDVRDADVLLVRSVTPVEPALLDGSAVRFVGSATIGTDHVDCAYLRDRGIAFAHAPASNADSVADYVIAALLQLAVRKRTVLRGKTIGVVGCGNIGSRLARRLPALGLRVLKNDPPRVEQAEEAGEEHDFVPLDDVLEVADIVTLHVPLTREGPHATHHLFDATTLLKMKPDAWLINTARGPVVDNEELKAIVHGGYLGAVALDVWEDEPTPDPALLRLVDLATPHIAGYAYDGKVRGTAMLYEALTDHLGMPVTWSPEDALRPADGRPLVATPPDPALPEIEALHHIARSMYDITADDARLRGLLDEPPEQQGPYFSRLRKEYPRRREFSRFALPQAAVPTALSAAVREGLSVGRQCGVELFARRGMGD